MLPDTSIGNHGSGAQNVAAGCGPQSNLNGAGTQNNYYGSYQDPQATEAERLRKEKEYCLRSLSFPNMDTRQQNIDDAHPNTCEWLFNTTEFKEWRDRCDLLAHNGVLWIKGKPGAGKSTLMNHTLSYCQRVFSGHLIVAYFFNARGAILEKTPLGMMRSILYQLLKKDDTLYSFLLDSYRDKRGIYGTEGVEWQQSELKKHIKSIAKMPRSKPLLLLIDALDECNEKEVRHVVGFLETLSADAVNVGVELRICLSSRHYPLVSMKKHLELTVERKHEHGRDIAAYIREKLYTKSDYIQFQVQKKADGIFMWVVLVVALLNKAYDEGRDEAIQKTLDEVPEDLEGLFQILLENGDSDRAELISMLQWVLFSKRRLKPEELYIAAVNDSPPSPEVIRRRITSSSKGFIEVRRDTRGTEFVQFIHLSVIDFLHRNKRLQTLDPTLGSDAISESHARLWAYCWFYINRLDDMSTDRSQLNRHRPFANHLFLGYATSYILDHADAALSSGNTTDRKLRREVAQWLTVRDGWLRWLDSANESLNEFATSNKYGWRGISSNDFSAGFIYILACAPYPNLLRLAVEEGADINARFGMYYNALQTASAWGCYEAMELLVENGADVNSQGGYYGNALQAASHGRSYEAVKFLIEKGADVNAQGGEYGNALQAASCRGNYKSATLLLKKGANVNAQGGYYGNALQAAACGHNHALMKLLIEKGADVDSYGGCYGNTIQDTPNQQEDQLPKSLLGKPNEPDARGDRSGNSPRLGHRRGQESYLLIEKGAEEPHSTPKPVTSSDAVTAEKSRPLWFLHLFKHPRTNKNILRIFRRRRGRRGRRA